MADIAISEYVLLSPRNWIFNILFDSSLKESGLLTDKSELSSITVEIVFLYRLAIDYYLTLRNRIESLYKLDDSRLSTTRWTHKTNLLTFFDYQIEVIQN